MKSPIRTFGSATIIGAAAAAALLAGSGSASAAVNVVEPIATGGEGSISTAITVVPLFSFQGTLECTVTATGVADATVTSSTTATLPNTMLMRSMGTIVVDGLAAGSYNVSVTCDDTGAQQPATTDIEAPVTVLPAVVVPPVDPPVAPPIDFGSSSLPSIFGS